MIFFSSHTVFHSTPFGFVSAERMHMSSFAVLPSAPDVHKYTLKHNPQHLPVFGHGPGPHTAEQQQQHSSRLWATGNLSRGVGEIRRGSKEMGC